MNCDAFRSHIDRTPTTPAAPWPDAVHAHHDGCADCQAWLAQEQTWQHVFTHVPAPRTRPSVWPGVMAAIDSRHAQPASLSRELVALSRYLVPAMAALVLALGGVGLWGQLTIKTIEPDTHPVTSLLVAEPATELAFLQEDADAILGQWAGVSQP